MPYRCVLMVNGPVSLIISANLFETVAALLSSGYDNLGKISVANNSFGILLISQISASICMYVIYCSSIAGTKNLVSLFCQKVRSFFWVTISKKA